jgi:hypothetical protein
LGNLVSLAGAMKRDLSPSLTILITAGTEGSVTG